MSFNSLCAQDIGRGSSSAFVTHIYMVLLECVDRLNYDMMHVPVMKEHAAASIFL